MMLTVAHTHSKHCSGSNVKFYFIQFELLWLCLHTVVNSMKTKIERKRKRIVQKRKEMKRKLSKRAISSRAPVHRYTHKFYSFNQKSSICNSILWSKLFLHSIPFISFEIQLYSFFSAPQTADIILAADDTKA